jgi:hypothetical protein
MMASEPRVAGKLLTFTPRGDSRGFAGESRVLRFQTKFGYRWGQFMAGVIAQRRLTASGASGNPIPSNGPFKQQQVPEISEQASVPPRACRAKSQDDESAHAARRPSAKPLSTAGCFRGLVREPAPHPMWRVWRFAAQAVDRTLSYLQATLLAYYALLGLTAFPLLASAHWLGGTVMALIGTVFTSLFFERMRLSSTQGKRPDCAGID